MRAGDRDGAVRSGLVTLWLSPAGCSLIVTSWHETTMSPLPVRRRTREAHLLPSARSRTRPRGCSRLPRSSRSSWIVGVSSTVVGGLAVAYWTSARYVTGDIDVLMPSVPEAYEVLDALGFNRTGRVWLLDDPRIVFEAPGSFRTGATSLTRSKRRKAES